jgi:hypothetical protein
VHAILSRRIPEFAVKRRQRDRFRQRFLPDQCGGKMYCIIRSKTMPTRQCGSALYDLCRNQQHIDERPVVLKIFPGQLSIVFRNLTCPDQTCYDGSHFHFCDFGCANPICALYPSSCIS